MISGRTRTATYPSTRPNRQTPSQRSVRTSLTTWRKLCAGPSQFSPIQNPNESARGRLSARVPLYETSPHAREPCSQESHSHAAHSWRWVDLASCRDTMVAWPDRDRSLARIEAADLLRLAALAADAEAGLFGRNPHGSGRGARFRPYPA